MSKTETVCRNSFTIRLAVHTLTIVLLLYVVIHLFVIKVFHLFTKVDKIVVARASHGLWDTQNHEGSHT